MSTDHPDNSGIRTLPKQESSSSEINVQQLVDIVKEDFKNIPDFYPFDIKTSYTLFGRKFDPLYHDYSYPVHYSSGHYDYLTVPGKMPYAGADYAGMLATSAGMPPEILSELSSWNDCFQSPYSYSFYDMPGKKWDYTPDGSLRIADHWNFESKGQRHCQTDKVVPPKAWAVAKYSGKTGLAGSGGIEKAKKYCRFKNRQYSAFLQ